MSGRPVFETVGSPHPDRAARVGALKALGFGWADLEEEPYWIDQAVAVRADVYDELERAAAALWAVFDKAARYVIGRRDLYPLLGIPEVLWDLLDTAEPGPPGLLSRYARFDFAISESGDIRLLELNADTPTGYVEAAVATPWTCEQHGLGHRNGGMAGLVAEAWAAERPEAAACVAYGSHAEDSGTIEMLVRHSGRSMRCLDCLELSIEDGVLLDGGLNPVRRAFLLYPKEWMAVDEGGEALAYAASSGQLALFNPPHAVLLQSKGLQALIWGLYELGLEFGEREREAIGAYMLPTYNKAVFDGSFVSKSMFGREGGSVRLYGTDGKLEVKDEIGFDTSRFFPRVFQKRAELAQIRLHNGAFHLLTGLFVLNGTPRGLLGRAGGPITGNASHFIAMGVQ